MISQNINYAVNGNRAMSEKNLEKLYHHIPFRPPYFAIEHYWLDREIMYGVFLCQKQAIPELPGICEAEVIRHMSVLGSLCIANAYPLKHKHFYLLESVITEKVTVADRECLAYLGKGYLKQLTNNVVIIEAVLMEPNCAVLERCLLQYAVFAEHSFKDKFQDKFVPTKNISLTNPYESSIKLKEIEQIEHFMTASFGNINEYDCLGHFSDYPILPLSSVIDGLTNLSIKLIKQVKKGKKTYTIKWSKADCNFHFGVGDKVDLYAMIDKSSGIGEFHIKAWAATQTDKVGVEFECWFNDRH